MSRFSGFQFIHSMWKWTLWSNWHCGFYSQLTELVCCILQFLHQAQSYLSINTLPSAERDMILQNKAAQREAKAEFDKNRLVDLSEQILLDCPAAQVYTDLLLIV